MASYNDYLEYLKHIDNTTEEEVKLLIANFNKDISKFKADISILTNKKNELFSQLSISQKELAARNSDLKTKELQLQKSTRELVEISNSQKETQTLLSEFERKYSEENKIKLEIQKELTNKVSEIKSLEIEICKIQNKNKDLQNKLKNAQNLYKVQQNEKEEISDEHNKLKNKFQLMETELKEKVIIINKQIIETRKLKSENDENNLLISNLSQDVNQYKNMIASQNETIDILESQVKKTKKLNLENETKILTLETNLNLKDNSISELTNKLSISNDLIVNLKLELSKEKNIKKSPSVLWIFLGIAAIAIVFLSINISKKSVYKETAVEGEFSDSITNIPITNNIREWASLNFAKDIFNLIDSSYQIEGSSFYDTNYKIADSVFVISENLILHYKGQVILNDTLIASIENPTVVGKSINIAKNSSTGLPYNITYEGEFDPYTYTPNGYGKITKQNGEHFIGLIKNNEPLLGKYYDSNNNFIKELTIKKK